MTRCNISGLKIQNGESAYLIVLGKQTLGKDRYNVNGISLEYNSIADTAHTRNYTPLFPPVKVSMGDYGRVTPVDHTHIHDQIAQYFGVRLELLLLACDYGDIKLSDLSVAACQERYVTGYAISIIHSDIYEAIMPKLPPLDELLPLAQAISEHSKSLRSCDKDIFKLSASYKTVLGLLGWPKRLDQTLDTCRGMTELVSLDKIMSTIDCQWKPSVFTTHNQSDKELNTIASTVVSIIAKRAN